jgi:hypothetical protein
MVVVKVPAAHVEDSSGPSGVVSMVSPAVTLYAPSALAWKNTRLLSHDAGWPV